MTDNQDKNENNKQNEYKPSLNKEAKEENETINNDNIIDKKAEEKIIISKKEENDKNDISFEKELEYIKENGKSKFEWSILKKYFIEFYIKVVESFPEEKKEKEKENQEMNKQETDKNITNIDEDIIEYINGLNKMPFTLQRMAELLLDPTRHYKKTNKYNSAFKKLVNIDFD